MALIDKLTDIADAIREKTGTSDKLTLEAMPTAISNIETGGGGDITAEDLTFSGSLNNMFGGSNWNWLLNRYDHLMSFNNISSAQSMFNGNTTIEDLSKLTIPLNNNANIQSMFSGCNKLKKLPKVTGAIDRYLISLFNSCFLLSSEEINNFFANITVLPTSSSTSYSNLFSNCYSVRNLGETLEWLHTNINTYTGTSSSFVSYISWFSSCIALDSILNMPVISSAKAPRTSNNFGSVVQRCYRLKDLIFKTNDGVPYTAYWKSQTIDFTAQLGYVDYPGNFISYGDHGITEATRVTDDASYQALKNDPDWWTTDINYCRYNHDSAVNTINSLPDTSAYLATAGGTNTIKFKGTSGSKTDGGAINTLTEAEIAVAAAKGWTVTLS